MVAIGLLIANLFQGLQTKKAADAAFQSAEISARAFRMDYRPWVHVGFATPVLVDGQPLCISIQANNTGKTPARVLTGDVVTELVRPTDEPQFVYKGRPHGRFPSTLLLPGLPATLESCVLPNPAVAHPQPLELTPSQHKLITGDGLLVITHLRFTYKDASGRNHWLTACDVANIGHRSGRKASSLCSEYNNTDEE